MVEVFLAFFLTQPSHETYLRQEAPFHIENHQNKMASDADGRGQRKGVKTGDSKPLMQIDRIVAWSFWTAKGLEPGTISRSWVAKFLKRSENFVKRNWQINPYLSLIEEEDEKDQVALSQESKTVIREMLARPKKKSVREIVKEVEKKRGKTRSYGTIYRFLRSEKANAFHIVTKPRISERSRENRLQFCDFLGNWDENDFLHLAPSDEFFVYCERKSNFQNDRIWAYSLEDIPKDDRIRQKSKYPTCIGIFIVFTARRMSWVIKEKGESWNGVYFRSKIILDLVIPFLQDPANVIDVNEVTFLHDKAPCMKAIATQQLLRQNDIDFFDNSQWPGCSPDLNVAENLGAIMKNRTEEALEAFPVGERSKPAILRQTLTSVLDEMSEDTELFEKLLKSYPSRLAAVKAAGGWHTKY